MIGPSSKQIPASVTLLIPAYNEEGYLPQMLGPLMQAIRNSSFHGFQIRQVVVIDDGSVDQTAKIARQLGAKVLRFKKNRGKIMAFVAGARFAKKVHSDAMVMLDADLAIDPRQISTQIGLLVRPVLFQHQAMTVGSVTQDHWELSGQRAFNLRSLEPLFRKNSKWMDVLGIERGRNNPDHGFGLERALNHLLKIRHSIPTWFGTQRKYGFKITAPQNEITSNLEQQRNSIRWAQTRIVDRDIMAGALRRLRQHQGRQAAREKRAQWKNRVR